MHVQAHRRLASFLSTAKPFLDQEEVLNHLILGIANRLNPENDIPEDSHLLSISDGRGKVVFAAVQSPGREMIVSGAKSAVESFLDFLKDNAIKIKGVEGTKALTDAIARHWENAFSGTTKVSLEHLIYALYEVLPVSLSEGKMRLAVAEDRKILEQWAYDFQIDAFGEGRGSREEANNRIRDKLEKQELFVWETNQIVSMASFARPGDQGVAINYVFTPKAFRKKGYARSLVAALSQEMLDRGFRFCTLFTDTHNSTTNKIYREIGYEPMGAFQSVALK